jgi:hypothetical protein
MRWAGITNLRGTIAEAMLPRPTRQPIRPSRATEIWIMNPITGREAPAPQVNGAAPQTCVICGDPIGDRCFCKISRKEGGPILLSCPSCVIQYLDSARPPVDAAEKELRDYEKNTHFFIGEDKPWL